uniref:Ethanolaminephosphotransferase n=1 Tax=Arundo donax TaxID=35708 RepID=A0A0A9G189_ARUDO
MFGGIQSGKRVTHRLQKGWSTYLATTEWSSPLYLYRFSVSTPCAPMNPIPARPGSRVAAGAAGELEGGGDRGVEKLLE